MTVDARTMTVKRALHKQETYDLEHSRCAGMVCKFVEREHGFVVPVWTLRLWSDTRNSVELCDGAGPDVNPLQIEALLDATDAAIEATPLGAVARLLDQAIASVPREHPLPHFEVGSYLPQFGHVVWIPSLGLAVIDRGSRPPTGTSPSSA
jgi:hypothetical protein